MPARNAVAGSSTCPPPACARARSGAAAGLRGDGGDVLRLLREDASQLFDDALVCRAAGFERLAEKLYVTCVVRLNRERAADGGEGLVRAPGAARKLADALVG